MSKTDIPYLQAVLNVTSGCTKISEGCAHCYAERINLRFGHTPAYDVNCPIKTHPERLEQALHWRTPRRAGVCFTSDLFHDQVPDEFIDKVFAVMALTPQHTYFLLTKRPERMREYFATGLPHRRVGYQGFAINRYSNYAAEVVQRERWPLPNVFLGVSCENQARADERIPLLLDTPAAHRWVSLEPLLGAITDMNRYLYCQGCGYTRGDRLRHLDHERCPNPTSTLDWCVVGGESGSHARPCNLGWIRDINQQCEAAGVKRYVKQVGAKPMLPYTPAGQHEWASLDKVALGWRMGAGEGISYRRGPNGERLGYAFRLRDRKGENPDEWPPDLRVREMPEGSE